MFKTHSYLFKDKLLLQNWNHSDRLITFNLVLLLKPNFLIFSLALLLSIIIKNATEYFNWSWHYYSNVIIKTNKYEITFQQISFSYCV